MTTVQPYTCTLQSICPLESSTLLDINESTLKEVKEVIKSHPQAQARVENRLGLQVVSQASEAPLEDLQGDLEERKGASAEEICRKRVDSQGGERKQH